MKKLIITAAIASMFSGAAFANVRPTPISQGVILSGGLGISATTDAFNANYNNTNNSTIKKQNQIGVNVSGMVGYVYTLSNFLTVGPEIGVSYDSQIAKATMNFGTNSETITRSLFSVPVVFMAQINPFAVGINIYGKAGFAFNNKIDSVSRNGHLISSTSEEKTTVDPVLVVGAGFNVFNLNLYLEGQYNYVKTSNTRAGVYTFSGGISLLLPIM